MRTPQELWANLQHFRSYGGAVIPVSTELAPGTTNAEYVIFTATRDVAIRRASVAARADMGTATATATLQNATDSEDISSSLDLSSNLDGDASDDFSMNGNADLIEEGDVIIVDYDSDTDPNELVIVLEVELLEHK